MAKTSLPRSAILEAITLAEHYVGATSPNPSVGAVVLDSNGEVLGLGAHVAAGLPHAEVVALEHCKNAGLISKAHTLFVTLEPCNHWGTTPPCTDAILASPIKHVVYGLADPNPRVLGNGAERLRAAGLEAAELEEGDLKLSCAEIVKGFFTRIAERRPFVRVKTAISSSGSLIPPAGHKTFTSPQSLTLSHALRKRSDIILTGSGTVLADDPLFTVRLVKDTRTKPRGLWVMDRRGRVQRNAKEWVKRTQELGFDLQFPSNIEAAFMTLGNSDSLEVLVEAGPQLTESILSTSYWDEHWILRQHALGPDSVEIRKRTP